MTRLDARIAPWSAEAITTLAAAAAHDTTGGLQSLAEVIQGGVLCELVERDAGAVVMRYVLRPVKRAHGRELQVLAAAGALPGADLTRAALAAILIQAEQIGAAAVTVHTRRAGLRRKLERAGFAVDGYILRRRLATCH